MMKYVLAFPASILLLSVSIPSAGQSFLEKKDATVEPRIMQGQTVSAVKDSPVIEVRPELTDEQLADLYMIRKEYREAAEVYKRISEQDPKNPVYLNKLGIAYHQQTALSTAMKYYERAAKADPLYADAQNNMGTIWYQRKKYGKAIRAYKKALGLRNDMAVLHSNLAYAYFGDKRYEESIAEFRNALAIDPQLFEHNSSRSGSILQDRSVTDRGAFYFLLAKSYAEAGNLERCILYLRKAKDEGYGALAKVKTDPAFSAYLNNADIQEVLMPKPRDDNRP